MKFVKYILLGSILIGSLTTSVVFADDSAVNEASTTSTVESSTTKAVDPSYNLSTSTTYTSYEGDELSAPVNNVIKPGENFKFGNILSFEGYTLDVDKSMVNIDGFQGSLNALSSGLNLQPQEIIDYINSQTWNGQTEADEQYIHLVYDKVSGETGYVRVQYQDDQGNQIADDIMLSGKIGDEYSSKQLDIEGYTFSKLAGNATGLFSEEGDTLIYIYTKNPITEITTPTDSDGSASGNTMFNNVSNQPTISKATSTSIKDDQATLPKTDVNPTNAISILGFVVAAIGSIGAFVMNKNN